jgi:hypothetical protein
MSGNDLRTIPQRSQPPASREALEELHAIRVELAALRRLFDHFAGTFLNAKFPYGKPVDRWSRR